MYVDESKTSFRHRGGGRTYYFCSKICLDTFLQPKRELETLKFLVLFSITSGLIIVFLDHAYPMLWKDALPGVDLGIIMFLLETPVNS